MDLLFLPLAVLIAMCVATIAERGKPPAWGKWLFFAAAAGSCYGSWLVPSDESSTAAIVATILYKTLVGFLVAIPAAFAGLGILHVVDAIWLCKQPLQKP